MPGPIKPSEVDKKKVIPEKVFEVFNRLIQENWRDGQAVVLQEDAAEAVANVLGTSRDQVYARNLLDVEDAYRKVGWDVSFDRPGYNETYPAEFTFKKKRSAR